MSLSNPISLMDIHSELSCLLLAAQKEFEYVGGMISFVIKYNQYTYLELEASYWGTIEEKKRITDILKLRLQRGLIWGEYDFRFEGVSYCTDFTDHIEPHYLTAKLNLSHWPHRRPRGWKPPVKPSEGSSRRVGKHPALGMPYGQASHSEQ